MLQSCKEFSRQTLEKLTVDELRKICKENGVSYYENSKRLAKGPMIDRLIKHIGAVIENEIDDDENVEPVKIKKKVKQPPKIKDADMKGIKSINDLYKTEEQIAAEEAERLERKQKYIEKAKAGTIVAVKIPNGNVISAMITKKSTKGRKFMVETQYGAEYKVSFDDVLWVKTGRWPKGVYLLFKQNVKTEVIKDGEDGEKIN